MALTRSAEEFAARGARSLQAGPQTNLLATVLGAIRADPGAHPQALFATIEEDGEVTALALRAPPRPMIASAMSEAAAAALIERWLSEDRDLAGLVAPAPTADAIAAAWERRSGGRARLARDEAAHRLERVRAPARPAAGVLRAGREEDHELLVRWLGDFAREVADDYGDAEATVARRLRNGNLFVWTDGGEPVCMIGVNDEVAGVVRIGPVYTPPQRRGRGYATSAVAAASEAALARGARACMLFTDLANPTSNRIYAEVGYERFADWRQYRLAPPAPAAG